jgi:hypothetical protein
MAEQVDNLGSPETQVQRNRKMLWSLIVVIIASFLILIAGGNFGLPMFLTWMAFLGFYAGLVGLVVWAVWAFVRNIFEERAELARLETTRPGFRKFYKEYVRVKREQEAQQEKILLGILIAAGAVHQAYKQNQAYNDLRAIRKRLE